jgi:glycosyltransferase involved in cell wall biosynthesis
MPEKTQDGVIGGELARLQTKRRRVALVDHTASISGAEIALFNLVIHLDRSQFEPVVVLFCDGPLGARLKEHGIETHVLSLDASVIGIRKDSLGLGSFLKLKQVVQTLRFIPTLAALLRSLRVELVHTNSLKADVIGGLAGRLAGVPVLWHVRDRIDSDYLPRQVVVVFRQLCRLIPNFVVANSAATLATIRPGENSLGETSRMRVVHDGTYLPDLRSQMKSVPADHATVTLVGRISRWKGQHVFIRAAEMVHRQFPGARFRIVGSALFGEAEYEREVRDLTRDLNVADCVEFTGFRDDVADLIAHSSIVVHASIVGEPFGQVVIEAMAAERPVVATNGGGVPEIVVEGTTGLLVPMGDAPAMAAAICRLLENPESAQDMGRNGRQRVADHFTIQNTASKMESVYREVLAKVTP